MDDRFVLDHDRCYRAAKSRDTRFDGWFVTAVRTTGIYCRPSCPAITPKQSNCEFFRTAAAAQQCGYRACKRCRPDATPGSPEWDVRSDLVGRAMRLIADGVVDREGVSGLAERLHYSERHLNRLLTIELGAGPIALARAQRAQTARILIETSDLSMSDIAFAAGFGSIRQFNDTVRDVYAMAPSALRRNAGSGVGAPREAGTVSVRLALRAPFAARPLLTFLADRAIPGVEAVTNDRFARTLDLPHGHGIVEVDIGEAAEAHLNATFRLSDWRDLAPAVERVRRLFDLDADPVAIDGQLSGDAALAKLVTERPGLRAPSSVDAAETAVRAIVGQQVSVAGARSVLARISASLGEPLDTPTGELSYLFPSMERLAGAPIEAFPMRRANTIHGVAKAVANGALTLDTGIDRTLVTEQLTAMPGIGPWTARYILMRGLGDPDVFLDTDLGVRHALDSLGLSASTAETWRPWRSYAVHHLWATLPRKEPT